MHKVAVRLLFLALALLGSHKGYARPVPPKGESQRQTPGVVAAEELTERAAELQRQGLRNEAIGALLKAIAADNVPKRHRNLGLLLEQANRLPEALREYRLFQRDQAGEPEDRRRDVAERVAGLLPRLGRVRLLPLSGPPLLGDEEVVIHLPEAGGERPRCVREMVAPNAPSTQDAGEPSPAGFVLPQNLQVYLCQPGPEPLLAELRVLGQVVAKRQVQVREKEEVSISFVHRTPLRITGNRRSVELRVDSGLPQRRTLPTTLNLLLGAHEVVGKADRDVARGQILLREGVNGVLELRFPPSKTWIYVLAGGAALALAGTAIGLGTYYGTMPAPPGGADLQLPPPQ